MGNTNHGQTTRDSLWFGTEGNDSDDDNDNDEDDGIDNDYDNDIGPTTMMKTMTTMTRQ